MSFYEAVTWLGRRVGIEVPKPVLTDEDATRYREREAQRIAMKGAVAFFENTFQKHNSTFMKEAST